MDLSKTDKKWLKDTWEKVDNKLSQVAVKSRFKLPYTTKNGVHISNHEDEPSAWTNGFWGGMMWLLYEATGNEEYKTTAIQSEKFLDRAFMDYKKLHHDVGFMWCITSGANYRLTGNTESCNKNLFMASVLFSRYIIDGKFIRAWNAKIRENVTIIDTLMNLPLLYWASREIGDDRFKKVAMMHTDMTMRDHVRDDGSIRHMVEHDNHTGECVKVLAGQGYSENSCWARGLAWAIYGFTLAYIHTNKEEYLNTAIKAADYFVSKCPEFDYLTPIDYDAPREPLYYDSTAGVCSACGLIELSKYVPSDLSETYLSTAVKVLKETDKHFCNYTDTEDSIVQMGSVSYPRNNNTNSVHIPIIYGDFFFVEALYKLKNGKFLIW